MLINSLKVFLSIVKSAASGHLPSLQALPIRLNDFYEFLKLNRFSSVRFTS